MGVIMRQNNMTKTAAVLFGFLLHREPTAQDRAPTISTPNPAHNFSAVSDAINAAIAQKKLPGAVVVVGHGGKVVFEQAYGVRKLAGEPVSTANHRQPNP